MTESGDFASDGNRIIRHDPESAVSGAVQFDEALAVAVEDHFADIFGTTGEVWHEIVSDLVHVDVHTTEPAPGGRSRILFTTGMSHRPMHLPEGADAPALAELMIVLPSRWPFDATAFQDEDSFWPVRLLTTLARFPHEYSTWLGAGHTVPNGDPPAPYAAGTELCGALLMPPIHSLPEAKRTIQTGDGRSIAILCVYPLYNDEMNLKLSQGTAGLFDALGTASVTDVIDPARPSAVPAPPKRRFRLF